MPGRPHYRGVRILHAVHAYPPDVGGSEAVIARLSEGMVERGHEVEVATSAHPDRGDAVGGVPVHGFEVSPAGVWRYRRFVHAGVREDRWDVVMVYHSKVFTHLALFPFSGIQDRWVYCPTEFTDIDSAAPRHLIYYRTVEPSSLRKARRSIVLNKTDRERALDLAGPAIDDRVEVIPNGVDHAWWTGGEAGKVRSRLGLPEGAPLVVYAGGLWEHKDVETLVRAVARLDGVHLAVAGSEKGRREVVEQTVRAAGVEDRVHLLGRVAREDLRALYHAGDAFASASTNEGFGLVYLEAMACGLPVVAREVGVIPELVDAGADVLVADDVTGFARAIESVLGQPSDRNVEVAERYDWEHIVDAWLDVYREVAEEGPA